MLQWCNLLEEIMRWRNNHLNKALVETKNMINAKVPLDIKDPLKAQEILRKSHKNSTWQIFKTF